MVFLLFCFVFFVMIFSKIYLSILFFNIELVENYNYCHNSFLVYSPNSFFLFQKIKNIFRLKTKKIQNIITVRGGCRSA
jgi:hypothetical protein